MKNGFTLLEVMIALVVTSFIAIGTFSVLNTSSKVRTVYVEQQYYLHRIDKTLNKMALDLQQFQPNRAVQDEFGDSQAAMKLESQELNLTVSGWQLSALSSIERSNMQRVKYYLIDNEQELCERIHPKEFTPKEEIKGDCLVRRHWTHLDNDGQSDPVDVPLMIGLEDLTYRFLIEGERQEWKSEPDISYSEKLLAIEISITTAQTGEVKRLFALSQKNSNHMSIDFDDGETF